jgi:putative DNA primase/helicase
MQNLARQQRAVKMDAQHSNNNGNSNGHANGHPAPYVFPTDKLKELEALQVIAHAPDEFRVALRDPDLATPCFYFTVTEARDIIMAMMSASRSGAPVRERVEIALEDVLAGETRDDQDSDNARRVLAAIYKKTPPKGTPEQRLKQLKQDSEASFPPLQALQAASDDNTSFSLDEIGNGARFAALHRADMRYCSVRQCWLIFAGGRWQIDEKGAAEARAKAIGRSVVAEAASETDDDRRSRMLKHALTLTKRATRETMLKDAASEPGMMVTPEQFDTTLHLFNVTNGTLDLNSFELRPHDPHDLLTHFSPVTFKQDADCPTWRRCMERWMPDQGTRDYCQDTFGLSLSGTVVEAFFNFLFGDGDNGKSTFLRMLELLMGSYSHKTQAETIMQARDQRKPGAPSPELLALKGARLVTVHEIDNKHKLNATLIKDMTGSDTVTARGLFDKRPTTFEPQFTLWMFGNGKPQIPDTSGGMWRRVRLINFGQPIPKSERDPHLSQNLRDELPGILNWALEGLRRVQQHGLIVPDAVIQATEEYRAEQDPFTDFLNEQCVIGPRLRVKNSDLWRAWFDWCKENGDREGTQRALGVELTRRKFPAYSNGKERGREGLTLKSLTQLTELTELPNKSIA